MAGLSLPRIQAGPKPHAHSDLHRQLGRCVHGVQPRRPPIKQARRNRPPLLS